ncbi:endolytic transglycosylase MltG [Streptomyces cremeus]|uniref:Endolytic murein transglycosylase n=1 Tax=Streptomyces cremeus TaxID=66881 RepID=A0ABV5PNK2_STRCM
MTEYGRGQGSEPWHPQAPGEQQYGDQGGQAWVGQQAGDGSVPHDGAYDGRQHYAPQGPPPQPYYDNGQYQQTPQHNGQYVQGHDGGQYPQAQQHTEQYGHGHDTGHDGGQYSPAYDSGQYAQVSQQSGQYPQQQGHGQQQSDWDTGRGQAIPYGMNAADPYSGQQPGYDTGQDHYGTPEAYPPPQPPGQRQSPPEPVIDWDEEARQKEEHPFFTGAPDSRGARDGEDGYDDEPAPRRGKGGGKGKKKGRNGIACLVVSVVLLGGLGGVGYIGYSFWKDRFGPVEDFEGEGTDPVQIEVKRGADGNEIANTLKKAGVVKSVSAFTAELAKDQKKGNALQTGVYVLKKEMSAKAALELMLSPASRNNYILPPGTRNAQVYEALDKRLELKPGTTKDIAKAQADKLGLPSWVPKKPDMMDRLEGFLYPGTYPVAQGTKPEDVLRKMVAQATENYAKQDLAGQAEKLGLESPFDVITVASLVQKEGKYKRDFDKVARVVYNRLQPNQTETHGRLQFDSTVNYLKSTSTLDIGNTDDLAKFKHPYNTYYLNQKGLPPGPISNPGDEALHSALNPTPGPWFYFISMTSENTIFTNTYEEHQRLVKQYNEERKKSKQ